MPFHGERPDPRLDRPLRPGPVMNNALTAIAQPLVRKAGNKAGRLGLQCGGQHLACALTGNLG